MNSHSNWKRVACSLLVFLLCMTVVVPVSAAWGKPARTVYEVLPSPEDGPESVRLHTDYEGYYTSRNGKKGLTLTFYRDGYTGELRAIFFFYPSQDPDWAGDYFSGAYSMKISVDGEHYELIADEWIDIGNHFDESGNDWVETAADLTMINLSGDLKDNTLSGVTNYDRPFEVTAVVEGEKSHSMKSPFAGAWGCPRVDKEPELSEKHLSCGAAIEQDEQGDYRIMMVVYDLTAKDYWSETPIRLTASHTSLYQDRSNWISFAVSIGEEKGSVSGTLDLWNGLLLLKLDEATCSLGTLEKCGLQEQYVLQYLGDFRLEAARMKELVNHPVQGMEIYVLEDADGYGYRLWFLDGKLICLVEDDENWFFAGETADGYRYSLRLLLYTGVMAQQPETLYTMNFPYIQLDAFDEYTPEDMKGKVVDSSIFPPIPPRDEKRNPSSGETPDGGEERYESLLLNKEYVGYYTTRHGQKGLTLVFFKDPYTGNLRAKFTFYPYPDPSWNGDYWNGSYSMNVSVNGDRCELYADEWIDCPGDLELIDLYGVLHGATLSGVSNYGRYFEVTAH